MDKSISVITDKELADIVEEIYAEVINDLLFEGYGDSKILYGPLKKKLRRVKGSLKIVRKNKKKLPLSLRKITKAAAKRRGRKSAISRKGKQKLVTRKSTRTTKKGRKMGLYRKNI